MTEQWENVWERIVRPKLQIGATFESRVKKSSYQITEFDEKSFTIERPETGSREKITRKKVEETAKRLANGERLVFQENPNQGGISNTVAVTNGVVWALGGLVVTDENAGVYSAAVPSISGVPNNDSADRTPLSDLLVAIANSYETYRKGGVTNKTAEAFQLVTQALPNELRKITGHDSRYIIEGSTGRGNLTPAPWIAIFDRSITDSATHGYYIVFLFSLDLLHVYLSIALGVTSFKETTRNSKERQLALSTIANQLASYIEIPENFVQGTIDLGETKTGSLQRDYEHSNIVGVPYDLTDLPVESDIQKDLYTFLKLYNDLKERVGSHIDEDTAVEIAKVPDELGLQEIPFVPRETKKISKNNSTSTGHQRRYSKSSKRIGDEGEKLVFQHEKDRLTKQGFGDLAARVRWLADEGEHPGYDILSFNEDGSARWIEVKASKGEKISNIELTDNEFNTAVSAKEGIYWLYLVTNVFKKPTLETIQDPVRTLSWGNGNPTPSSWRLELY